MKYSRSLSWIEVGISLVTLHYGLGFLIGSGEAIFTDGPRGIVYALSTAIGLLSLVFIAKYYWRKKEPIWNLMGNRHGKTTKEIITFLSCIWMIGVVASQVQGGAAVLQTFQIPFNISVIIMTLIITLLSLVALHRLVKFFLAMLISSSVSLLLVLLFIGNPTPSYLYASFAQSTFSFSDILGILLPTVLVTFIGMDFHQFIVKSRSTRDAVKGSVLGCLVLVGITLLLYTVVQSALQQNLLYNLVEPRQTVPLILSNFGVGISSFFSTLLVLPIIFVAIGSGSGVNRIVQLSMTNSKILPIYLRKKPNVFVIVFLFVLVISFTGDSIVDLIVAFYAIYVGSVFIPFITFLLDEKYNLKLKKNIMIIAITISVIVTLAVYLYTFMPDTLIPDNKSIYMVLAGFATSLLVILIGNNRIDLNSHKRYKHLKLNFTKNFIRKT